MCRDNAVLRMRGDAKDSRGTTWRYTGKRTVRNGGYRGGGVFPFSFCRIVVGGSNTRCSMR